MEMALSEITLVLFTTIAPAGLFGYAVVALFGLFATRELALRASRYLVIPLVLVISGLIASATHLGTPANALYVLTGFGRSPLSNEVVVLVGFLVVGGVYWMLSFRDDMTRGVQKAALAAGVVAGLLAIGAISAAYSVGTVPTWSLPTAPLTLWLGAAAPGAIVGLFVLLAAGVPASRRFVTAVLAVAALAAIADGVVLGVQWQLLGDIQTTVQSAQDLVPLLPVLAVAYPLLCLVALGVTGAAMVRSAALVPVRGAGAGFQGAELPVDAAGAQAKDFAATAGDQAKGLSVARVAVCASGVLLLCACFVVRFCFYAMYMTAGV